MITINDKVVVLQETLVLNPNDTARMPVQDVAGMVVKIRMGARDVMPARAEDLEKSVAGGEFTFEFPFLENKFTMNASYDVTYSGQNLTLLISAHGVGDASVVHVQLCTI